MAGVVGLVPGVFEPAMANRGEGGGGGGPTELADVSITQSAEVVPPVIQLDRIAQATALTGVGPGDQIAYTIKVENLGPAAAENVSFTDTLPAFTTLVDAVLPGPGATCTVPPVAGVITCQLGTMAPGATAVFVFTVLIDPATPGGTVLTNTVQVTSSTADPNLANNTATTTATVRKADLMVTKVVSDPDVAPGDQLTYTISITNLGPDDEPAVTLTDQFPANISPNLLFLPPACTFDAPTVTCQFVGPFLVGTTLTLPLEAVVEQGAQGSLTNTVTVAGLAASTDLVPGNNTATATVTVGGSAIVAGDEGARLVGAPAQGGDELVAGTELPRTGSRSIDRQIIAALALIAAGLPVFFATRRRRPSGV
jgi:uncharacterized repeat protein (TIGR01451 family)